MTMLPDRICSTCGTNWHSYEYYACWKCNPGYCKIPSRPMTVEYLEKYKRECREDITKYKKKIQEREKDIKRIERKIGDIKK